MPLATPQQLAEPLGPRAYIPAAHDTFKECVDAISTGGHEFDRDAAVSACRDILHLPWYSHTQIEPAINWLRDNSGSLLVTAVICMVAIGAWKSRRALTRARRTIGRGVYAVTGYR